MEGSHTPSARTTLSLEQLLPHRDGIPTVGADSPRCLDCSDLASELDFDLNIVYNSDWVRTNPPAPADEGACGAVASTDAPDAALRDAVPPAITSQLVVDDTGAGPMPPDGMSSSRSSSSSSSRRIISAAACRWKELPLRYLVAWRRLRVAFVKLDALNRALSSSLSIT